MQFNQVRYFLSACDVLNFTRAAEICNVSQPALTVAIGKLEEELGGKLFEREGRQLSMTELGQAMRIHLTRIEETRDAAKRAATTLLSPESEIIDVGVMCTLSPDLLMSRISKWSELSSGVEILLHDIQQSRVQELLLSGTLDCALLARTEPLPPRFSSIKLFEESMIVALPSGHKLCAKSEITALDLASTCYVDRLRCEFRSMFFKEMKNRDLHVRSVMRSEREDLMVKAVQHGMGVSIMPQHAAAAADLEARRLVDFDIVRTIELVTVANVEPKPSVTNLMNFIADG